MIHPLRVHSFSLRISLAIFTAGALALAFGVSPAWSATAPDLGTAAAASVVAGSTVTNTGSSTLSGNLDVYPGTAVTGFPPGLIGGTQNVGGPTGGPADVAANDVTNAYLEVLAAPTTAVMNADLGGQTLGAGVYSASSSMSLTGTLTLIGNANSVFIFQSVSTLITAPGSRVVLSGGVQACNVDWQVGSSATIATTTSFVGNILALSSITMNTGATLEGRALARNGAVTLDDNTITSPTCNLSAPTTSTTAAPSTTTTGWSNDDDHNHLFHDDDVDPKYHAWIDDTEVRPLEHHDRPRTRSPHDDDGTPVGRCARDWRRASSALGHPLGHHRSPCDGLRRCALRANPSTPDQSLVADRDHRDTGGI